MEVGQSTVQAVYALSTLSGPVLGYVLWRHRDRAGALPLLGSVLGGTLWSAALFLATVTPSYDVSVLLLRSLYVGVVIVVAAIFLFALEYTGREHLVNRWTIALLSVQPAIVVVLAFANPENVFFSTLAPDPATTTGVHVEWGVGFWLHTAYSYVITLSAVALIVGMLFRTQSLFRGQVVVLTAAVVSPSIGNLATIVGPVPFDATPVGFVVANALFTAAITRHGFIEITPIAYDRVVDTVGDAIFVVDRDGRVVDVNPAGRAMLEELIGEGSIVGRHADDLVAAIPGLRARYRELAADGEAGTVEFSLAGRHYEVTETSVTDGRDRTLGRVFLVGDVTHRERRERELRRRNEQLDQFAKVVSHDLRNPLAVAQGYADLARETGDLAHLDEVASALQRMDAIVDDVLTLARGEEGAIDPSAVDVRAVAEGAWRNVETDSATLRVDGTTAVLADRERLARLLENLFRNAVEHGVAPDEAGDVGRPPLEIEVGLLTDGEAVRGLYVADDGPGVPEQARETVFEAGYTTSAEGTGLGLRIVRQIADAHGWDVRMTESDAGGARVEITGVETADEHPEDGPGSGPAEEPDARRST